MKPTFQTGESLTEYQERYKQWLDDKTERERQAQAQLSRVKYSQKKGEVRMYTR
jgi:hypothetical protein